MRGAALWIIVGGVAVVALDAVVSAAAHVVDFGDLWLLPVWLAIYAAVAYAAAREWRSARVGAGVGAAVAAIDATAGRAVALLIAPDVAAPDGTLPPGAAAFGMAMAAIVYTALGAAVGLVAGLVARRF